MIDAPVTVRVATPADMSEIMAMAVEASKENAFMAASTELLVRTVWGPLNQDHGIIGCIGEHGHLEAMVVLCIGTVFYSYDPCIEEKTLYVRPAFRRGKVGRARKLMEFSKSSADVLGLPLLIGVLSNERTKAKCKLYERVLGPPAGAYWIYRTRTGGHEVAA